MKALSEPLEQLNSFIQVKEYLQEGKGPVHISGTECSDRVFVMNGCAESADVRLVVTYDEERANRLYEDFRFYEKNVLIYPSKDVLFFSADIHGNAIVRRRMEIFKSLIEGERCTIVLTVDALLDKIPELSYIKSKIISLKEGDILDVDKFKSRLVELGYEKTETVEGVGEFAIRGGIIDIFPLTEETPYRIDMWDDEIDTIRSFDVESQRSIERVESVNIYPATEMVLSKTRINKGIKAIEAELKPYEEKLRKSFRTEAAHRIKKEVDVLKEQLTEFNGAIGVDGFVDYFYSKTMSLLDCIPADACILLDEPRRIKECADLYMGNFNSAMKSRLEGGYILPGQLELLYPYESIAEKFAARRTVLFSALYYKDEIIPEVFHVEIEAKTVISYKNSFEALVADIERWKSKDYRIILISPSATRGRRLADNLMNVQVSCFFSEDKKRVLKDREMMITTGRLRSGFEFPDMKLAVISEGDIFTSRTAGKSKNKKKSQYSGEVIKSYTDISVGDYVIHEKYGIGIYRGIEQVEVDNVY